MCTRGIWSIHCSWRLQLSNLLCCFPLALANTFPWPFVPIFSNFFVKREQTENWKPHTMPFRIVACTFPDNFSRNSCIKDIRRPNRKEERQSLTPTSFSSTCPTTHTSPTQINLLTLLHWLKNAKLICHTDTTQIFNDIQSLFSSIKPGTPFCLFLVSLLPFVIRFLSVSHSTPFWSCPLTY